MTDQHTQTCDKAAERVFQGVLRRAGDIDEFEQGLMRDAWDAAIAYMTPPATLSQSAGAEPVAVIGDTYSLLWTGRWPKDGLKVGDKLYAAPQRQAVEDGLTDEQIRAIAVKYGAFMTVGEYDITKYDCEEDFFNCVRAILAAPRQPGEMGAGVQCETCNDTGQHYIGNSGRESDGNAPEFERCPECGYGDASAQQDEREAVTLPAGFSIKRIDGHGWVIDPPAGSRWVAHENTPAGDFLAALLAAQQVQAGAVPIGYIDYKGPCNHPRAVLTTAFDAKGDGWVDGTKIYAAPQVQADAGAVALLKELTDAQSEVCDHTPESFGKRIASIATRAHTLLAAHPSPAAESDKRDAERWRLAAATWKVFRVEVVPGVTLSHPKGIPFEDLATQADAAMSREQSGGDRG